MNFKTSVSAALVCLMSLVGVTEASYDLPKIKIEKKKTSESNSEKGLKGDWYDVELFEQKMKLLLEKNPDLPPSSPERLATDKNLVFIAFYKDYAYFLDRYSIKLVKNSEQERSWTQYIFPIGSKVSGKNS